MVEVIRFFTIYKESTNGTWASVYKSEVISDTLQPHWKPIALPISELCCGNYERKLKIRVDDYDSIGSDDEIGSIIKTVSQLETRTEIKLTNKRDRQSGRLRVDLFRIVSN